MSLPEIDHPTYPETGDWIMIGDVVEKLPNSYGHTYVVIGFKAAEFVWLKDRKPRIEWVEIANSNGSRSRCEPERLRAVK